MGNGARRLGAPTAMLAAPVQIAVQVRLFLVAVLATRALGVGQARVNRPALPAGTILTVVAPLTAHARHVPRVPGPQVAPPPAQTVL